MVQVTDGFLQYASKEERKILALSPESFECVDKDDLMDVLYAHDCHYLASEDTMAGLISQLGQNPNSDFNVSLFVEDICPSPSSRIYDACSSGN